MNEIASSSKSILAQKGKEGSVVERTIYATLPNPKTTTPSSLSSISQHIELLHRINGTSIISQCTTLLRLSASTYATSTTIFHRFYHRKSLKEYDVWSTSMAAVILACKVEEEIRRVSEVILVFVHVYRRMRFAMGSRNLCGLDDMKSVTSEEFQTALCPLLLNSKVINEEERQNILRYIQPLPRTGLVFKEWESELMLMENVVLRELGFSLFWIPENHPHVFLLYFMKVLELVDNESSVNAESKKSDEITHDLKNLTIAQIAWNYCNDSCRLDLCVRYEAELIVSFH